jgi:biotin carboxylase
VNRRVLLIASTTGYQTHAFAEASRRLAVELTLATDRCHVLEDPWGDQAVAVRFDQPEKAVAKLSRRRYDGIVALGDGPAVLAAGVASRLGIPYHPPAAVAACHDKHTARRLFAAAGLPVPKFVRIPLGDGAARWATRAEYPCVLKPLGLSASRGVIRADSPTEFVAAFERIHAILQTPELLRQRDEVHGAIQVESFIPGQEFALEGVVTGGCLEPLAMFDKPDPLDGPYFEETIYITPSRAPAAAQQEMLETVQRGIRALGLRQGPVHAELRYNARGAWLLEIAARPIGGLCAKALQFEGGATLEDIVLRHALGERVGGLSPAAPASGVMMIPIPKSGIYEGVSGEEKAAAVEGIESVIITAVPGQRLFQLPEGNSYLGFLFARGGSPKAVEEALREAHGSLQFRMATVLPVSR